MGPGEFIICVPPIYIIYARVPFISSVWDYVPTEITYAGRVELWEASDSIAKRRDSSIAWTRVHAITNYNTCAKLDLSEVTYLSFGNAWRHKERPIFIRRMTRDSSRMHDHEDLHQRISSDDRDSMSRGSLWKRVDASGCVDLHQTDVGSPWIVRSGPPKLTLIFI